MNTNKETKLDALAYRVFQSTIGQARPNLGKVTVRANPDIEKPKVAYMGNVVQIEIPEKIFGIQLVTKTFVDYRGDREMLRLIFTMEAVRHFYDPTTNELVITARKHMKNIALALQSATFMNYIRVAAPELASVIGRMMRYIMPDFTNAMRTLRELDDSTFDNRYAKALGWCIASFAAAKPVPWNAGGYDLGDVNLLNPIRVLSILTDYVGDPDEEEQSQDGGDRDDNDLNEESDGDEEQQSQEQQNQQPSNGDEGEDDEEQKSNDEDENESGEDESEDGDEDESGQDQGDDEDDEQNDQGDEDDDDLGDLTDKLKEIAEKLDEIVSNADGAPAQLSAHLMPMNFEGQRDPLTMDERRLMTDFENIHARRGNIIEAPVIAILDVQELLVESRILPFIGEEVIDAGDEGLSVALLIDVSPSTDSIVYGRDSILRIINRASRAFIASMEKHGYTVDAWVFSDSLAKLNNLPRAEEYYGGYYKHLPSPFVRSTTNLYLSHQAIEAMKKYDAIITITDGRIIYPPYPLDNVIVIHNVAPPDGMMGENCHHIRVTSSLDRELRQAMFNLLNSLILAK